MASTARGTRIRRAILASDVYRLATSIRERTGCSMRRARQRARSIKNLVRPSLTTQEIRRLMSQPQFRHDARCIAPLVPCRCSGQGARK
jgi:hypothetical protein